MKNLIKKILPTALMIVAFSAIRAVRVFLSRPPAFKCPICDKAVRGYWSGLGVHTHLTCSKCHSLSRQRLISLWIRRHLRSFTEAKSCLHVAVEPCLKTYLLQTLNIEKYVTADQFNPADIKLDITDTNLESESFDLIIVNHVFEHVGDDQAAASEVYRILKPGGRGIVSVPIIYSWPETYTNPDIVTEADREKHFGQYDHVRFYGRDFLELFEQLGFKVQEVIANGLDSVEFGLDRGEVVLMLEKD